MGDGRALRQKCVRKPTAFKRIVLVESRVKAKFVFAVFADYHAGLIVADFNNVRFRHGFPIAGRDRHPLVNEL
ncbi:hypothetical protein [Hyphomicrobium sp.]|uniref:hypothetical protein n=1 Tax=Hyphomicrobium sp. TaxID=82 RepID=UPI0039C897D0